MRIRFATAFVAVSTLLLTLSVHAFAHTPPRVSSVSQPADVITLADQVGTASFYGKAHNGRRAADGSRFDQMAMTAAHPWLPFGTKVKVTLLGTGRSVIVTITDRLPSRSRIVDLSFAAARDLGMIRQGVGQVSLSML